MKANNIYDDATIIVTADHGDTTNTQAIFLIKNRFAHADTVQYNHAPVAQQDFDSTILKSLDLPYDDYGPSVFDYKESDMRERSVHLWRYDEDFPDLNAKYNVMYEFKYIGDEETAKSLIKNKIYEVHELKDSFYR